MENPSRPYILHNTPYLISLGQEPVTERQTSAEASETHLQDC